MTNALQQAVAAEIASGARLESQMGTMAVVVRGKPVNHILHLILSLLTAGIWLIVWLVLVLTNKRERVILTVDEAGTVSRSVATGGQAAPRSLCGRCGKLLSPVWRDKCAHCGARFAEYPPVTA